MKLVSDERDAVNLQISFTSSYNFNEKQSCYLKCINVCNIVCFVYRNIVCIVNMLYVYVIANPDK